MLIIDSHAHLKHGDAAGTECSADAVVEAMDAAGIDRSVVFAMQTTTRRSIEMADRAVRQFPGRLIPYVYAVPSFERSALAEIDEAITEHGARGIKIHEGECCLRSHVIDPVFELATARGVPCLIDCRGNLAAMERVTADFPKTTVIIAHLGRYLCEDGDVIDRFIHLAESRPNVVLDASGVVLVHKIAEAVHRIGSDRVVWGTDGPHAKPDTATFARDELAKVHGLDLSEDEKADLLGNTIARVLGIE
jgi:predicted TIM-barrel fold metal-dependent hydrolase